MFPQLDEILAKKGLHIDKVINLKIDDKLLVRRVLGRYADKKTMMLLCSQGVEDWFCKSDQLYRGPPYDGEIYWRHDALMPSC